ncbi:chromosome segregation in meiosis protein 3 [Boeremia exigua]|uniref:chromosome segregation in meiosis protein 3 n=1 Tax=Boeremia exigua TaxID=749465 RepID=UPI001E8DFDF2|nr:chromosome segregation in meiosis protein 3 [Boeremia exigua]KAH6616513.1 chromosome segregation in meiosis protein 3 [Boeremia exigua]
MAATNPQPVSGDELDDILSGIAAEGGYGPVGQSQPERTTISNKVDTGLGIDEEIVVTKKRIPIPKLDDVRLRSEAGIPRLRRISKERLRFKGKGHEYGDIARMLNMYQLWLDDLYPRAKFADALAIIEKVGHTKRMQVDRKAWMDEGKPKHTVEEDDFDLDVHVPDEVPAPDQTETVEGQESEAIVVELQPSVEASGNSRSHPQLEAEEPDEDELDALLADSGQTDLLAPTAIPSRTLQAQNDPFADEMEAMEGMEDMW